jgi:hypothetical protein
MNAFGILRARGQYVDAYPRDDAVEILSLAELRADSKYGIVLVIAADNRISQLIYPRILFHFTEKKLG